MAIPSDGGIGYLIAEKIQKANAIELFLKKATSFLRKMARKMIFDLLFGGKCFLAISCSAVGIEKFAAFIPYLNGYLPCAFWSNGTNCVRQNRRRQTGKST
jgi:hypothetical protein